MAVTHVRIDNRLIHGQVAMLWKNYLDISHIIVSNNKVASDLIQTQIIKSIAPTGVKVSVLSTTACVEYCNCDESKDERILIILKHPEDGLELIEKGLAGLAEVTVGNQAADVNEGIKFRKGLYLSQNDIQILQSIHDKGIKLINQMVPNDSPIDFWNEIERKVPDWIR